MVFHHFEPKSFKNHRFFDGFEVRPGPDPARARPRSWTGLAGAQSFKNHGFSMFFPRARAKGSCCLRLPLGVWIELGTMPERAVTIEKSKENLRFFNIFSLEASKTNGFSTFWL